MCSRRHEVMHPTASVIRMIIGGSVDKFVGRICARRVGSSVWDARLTTSTQRQTKYLRDQNCALLPARSYTQGFAVSTWQFQLHYNDVIMTTIASQITSLTVVYSIVYSDADQRKHQSSASLAFVRGIHRRPVNFPHKWPVTRKMFSFDDVIMQQNISQNRYGWFSSVLW